MTHPRVREELDSLGFGSGVEAEDVTEPAVDPDQIREPFDPDRIDVITRTPTVDLLLSRIRTKRIDLQPKAGTWSPRTKSRLIESLLLRIPLPNLYAAENDDDSWGIVDGIQRLTAICEFIEPAAMGVQPLRLHDLEYLTACEGKAFTELTGRLQTRLHETELVVHLVRRGTPEEVKFNIFARINTGGLPLTAQELRHALIPGKARTLLAELAGSELFSRATSGTVTSDRMVDREMVLRFLAFRMADPFGYAQRDFDKFLRESMRKINSLSSDELEKLTAQFHRSMESAYFIFGDRAFRRQYRNDLRRYPISKALFEAVAVNLAALSAERSAALVGRRARVNDALGDLMMDGDFERAISAATGDPKQVRRRFQAIGDLFDRVLDDPGTGSA